MKSITEQFILYYNTLKGVAFKNNKELAEVLGYKSANSITEITMGRQQIDPSRYNVFMEKYKDYVKNTESTSDLKKENELLKELIVAKDKAILDKEKIIQLLEDNMSMRSESKETNSNAHTRTTQGKLKH